MTMTDPIADMLTRIRNAHKIKALSVSIPYSKTKESFDSVPWHSNGNLEVLLIGPSLTSVPTE